MSIDRSRVMQWLRAEVYRDHRDGPVKRVVLRHVAGDKLASEITSQEVPAAPDEAWLVNAVGEFELAAISDADGAGGMQKYCLLSYRVDDRSSGRLPFRIMGEADDEESLSSEPATAKGFLAQLMRHNEASARIATQSIQQVLAAQHHTIEEQAAMLKHLTAIHFENIREREELLDRKHERELETRRAELRDGMVKEAIEKVQLLAPVVINRLAGQKLLPQETSTEGEALRAFLQSLSEEQFQAILGALKPEQKVALSMFVDSVGTEKTQ